MTAPISVARLGERGRAWSASFVAWLEPANRLGRPAALQDFHLGPTFNRTGIMLPDSSSLRPLTG